MSSNAIRLSLSEVARADMRCAICYLRIAPGVRHVGLHRKGEHVTHFCDLGCYGTYELAKQRPGKGHAWWRELELGI